MKVFSAVCGSGSVTKAAAALGITQPAVSLCIRELEEHYGVRLFDRIAHKLYLTAEGKKLLGYARKIIALFDEAESDVTSWREVESLRIGSSITIGTRLMPGYVERFRAACPGVRVSVTVDNSAEIEKRILKNELDFALIEGIVHSENIVSEKFRKDSLVPVCGAKSAWAGRGEFRPEELPGLPFLLREKGSGTRELFDSTLLTLGITVMPEWESISTGAIISAVEAGAGLSVLPFGLVERELAAKKLTRVSIRSLRFERYFCLIFHKDKHLSKAAALFLQKNGIAPSGRNHAAKANPPC